MTKVIELLVLAFSICMFCYQTQIAIQRWIYPPIVDSNDVYNIADAELPVITICAKNQFDQHSMRDFGYNSTTSLLGGIDARNPQVFSWGALDNLSFFEVVDEIQFFDKVEPYAVYDKQDGNFEKLRYEKRFYPMFGWCADVVHYPMTDSGQVALEIRAQRKTGGSFFDAEVFLTAKKLRTKHTINKQSHIGSKIIIRHKEDYEFMVEVKQMSNYDPRNPDACKEFEDNDFEKCANEELKDIFKPVFKCYPPWISSQNQCNGIIKKTEEMKNLTGIKSHIEKTIKEIVEMKTFSAKKKCFTPCSFIRSTLISTGIEKGEGLYSSTITLNFNEVVLHRTKRLAYEFSDFLIDMGSSLGLWFGLSVFGITDLVVTAFQWVYQSVKNRY